MKIAITTEKLSVETIPDNRFGEGRAIKVF